MADITQTPPVTAGEEASPSFRSFWKNAKAAYSKPLVFLQHKDKGELSNKNSSAHEEEKEQSNDAAAAAEKSSSLQRRRKQVYEAQK